MWSSRSCLLPASASCGQVEAHRRSFSSASCLPFLWGFYQEFAYRGLLQTEIVRRTGPAIGILISNAVFTFGPLHFYHFRLAQGDPSHLWIVGIMHGFWPLNFQ